jgi:hypothetical protein
LAVENARCGAARAPSISLGVMLESDWRQLYIRGVMPEDAADQAYAHYWITRGFEQMGKR